MARLPRFVIPGQPQHIIMRGNNRSEIFCASSDYLFFLEKLQQACNTHEKFKKFNGVKKVQWGQTRLIFN